MDITNIKEALIWRIFRTTIATNHEDVVRWGQRDGDGIMQDGRSSIRPPVYRIDSHAGSSDDWLYVFHILHCIVANSDARVCLTLGRADMTALRHIGFGHLVTQDVCRSQLAIGIVVDVLQQFHHSQAALTEASDNERTALIPMGLSRKKKNQTVSDRLIPFLSILMFLLFYSPCTVFDNQES